MSFPLNKVTTVPVTGVLTGVVAGTVTPGATISVNSIEPFSLVGHAVLDAETDTLTMYLDWQVSDDASTWFTVKPANGAANVIQATGTGGADAAVTVVLEAPPSVYSFRYARLGVRNQVANGLVADTYSLKYHYLKPRL